MVFILFRRERAGTGTGNEVVVAVRFIVGWSDLGFWIRRRLDRAARTPRMSVAWSEIGS